MKKPARKKIARVSYNAWEKKQLEKPEVRAGYKEMAVLLQIAELREKKGWSQREFAKKAKMPQSVIARLESGGHNATIETLNKVAGALGKKIELV